MFAVTSCAESCTVDMSLGVVLQVAGQLFGVTVEAADGKAPVWNSDVRFFCIKQDGKPRAYFFFVSICQPFCLIEVEQPCFHVLQHCIMHIMNNGFLYVTSRAAWSCLEFCVPAACGHLHALLYSEIYCCDEVCAAVGPL